MHSQACSPKNCEKRLVASSYVSVRPHETPLISLEGFHEILYWRLLLNSVEKIQETSVKTGKKLRTLYSETSVHMCNWWFERVALWGTSWGRRNIWRSKHNDRTCSTRNLPSEQSRPLLRYEVSAYVQKQKQNDCTVIVTVCRHFLISYKTGMHVSIAIAYSSSLVLILRIITASELRCAAVM
jgi:hypothetical protein